MTRSEEETFGLAMEWLGRFRLWTSEPVWSSYVLEQMLEEVVGRSSRSLEVLYRAMDGLLRSHHVKLNESVAHLLKDVAAHGFLRVRDGYDQIEWAWADESLARECSAAQCYFFVQVLPPGGEAGGVVAILRGLTGTAHEELARSMLQEELTRPGVARLMKLK